MKPISIIGAGLAGCEAALQCAHRGVDVRLFEMRPGTMTEAHRTGDVAELVCSNSLKSTEPHNAHGLLKEELRALGTAPDGDQNLLDVHQAAERLGMSVSWVYRAIEDGRLPSVKLGNRVRVRSVDIEAFIAPRAG